MALSTFGSKRVFVFCRKDLYNVSSTSQSLCSGVLLRRFHGHPYSLSSRLRPPGSYVLTPTTGVTPSSTGRTVGGSGWGTGTWNLGDPSTLERLSELG